MSLLWLNKHHPDNAVIDSRHNRYAFLDGIRGMAAIFVLMRHTGNYWHFEFFRSYLAVDLFFILSGFIIAHAYDEKIRNGSIKFRQFVGIRLIRLYPVFFLSLIISTCLLIAKLTLKHEINLNDLTDILSVVALTALFLPSHLTGNVYLFPINAIYWSLFFELISNFIYAAIRPLLNNIVLAVIILVSALLIFVTSYRHGSLDTGYLWDNESLVTGFSRSIFGIFVGLMLYRYQEKFKHQLRKSLVAWLAFLVIAVILASPSVAQYNWAVDAFIVVVIFPVALLCASQGNISRVQKLLLLLGSASYPIYVLHTPVSIIFSSLFKSYIGALAPLSGIVLVIILIALSVWVEKIYDIPLRRWMSNRILKKG